jgi:hypothetical protein
MQVSHIAATLRWWLARHRWFYWIVLAGCVAATASAAWSLDASWRRERATWGTSRAVWIAAGDIAPGEEMMVVAAEWPLAIVPPGALDAAPAHGIARQRIGAGEVVTVHDVRPADDAELVPRGHVAVPINGVFPMIIEGSRVRIMADGVAVGDGSVARAETDWLLVVLPVADAPAVAAAAHDGRASVGLLAD